jgi:AhpD family alkylhydroperoxidase
MKDYRALAAGVSRSTATLRVAISEMMRGFTDPGHAACGEGAPLPKFKELIALATAISQRCDDRIAYLAKHVAELGATREEVIETIAIAARMGGESPVFVGGKALEAFDSFQGTTSAPTQEKH